MHLSFQVRTCQFAHKSIVTLVLNFSTLIINIPFVRSLKHLEILQTHNLVFGLQHIKFSQFNLIKSLALVHSWTTLHRAAPFYFIFCFLIIKALFSFLKNWDFHDRTPRSNNITPCRTLKIMWNVQKSDLEKKFHLNVCARVCSNFGKFMLLYLRN